MLCVCSQQKKITSITFVEATWGHHDNATKTKAWIKTNIKNIIVLSKNSIEAIIWILSEICFKSHFTFFFIIVTFTCDSSGKIFTNMIENIKNASKSKTKVVICIKTLSISV